MRKLIALNVALTAVLFAITGGGDTPAVGEGLHLEGQATPVVAMMDTLWEGNLSQTIRIGLESRYYNASVITLTNQRLFFGDERQGDLQVRGAIASEQGFRIMVDHGYYLDLQRFFATFEEAYIFATQSSEQVLVQVTETGFGLVMGPFYATADALSAQQVSGGQVLAPNHHRVRLTNGVVPLLIHEGHLQVMDGQGGFVSLGGRQYRGIMELGRQTGQGITPVNIVDVEQYLFSVVPSEMPASWHLQALKAQTVAARSFTYARRGSHNHLGYELCDTVFSQVYAGVGMEHENSTQAVLQTHGMKAWHGERPILATYFSSSGGFTESSQYVWLEAVPYLVAVQDPFEQGAMVWERQFTLTQINQFAANQNIQVGHIGSISTVGQTPGGRVQALVLHGANGNHTIEREQIRTFFNGSPGGSLESRTFSLVEGQTSHLPTTSLEVLTVASVGGTNQVHRDTAVALTRDGLVALPHEVSMLSVSGLSQGGRQYTQVVQSTGYVINLAGRGWGHGVGMSQFGAQAMAEQGFDFVGILQHYFTGVEVR